MSLKLKLGLLIFLIMALLLGTSFVYTRNAEQLASISDRRRLNQIVAGTGDKLALSKLILQSDLPDKNKTIAELLDDIFLAQTTINAIVKLEAHPEANASLRELQTYLVEVDLLLSRLHLRLTTGEELSSDDHLLLEQLDSTADSITFTMQEYESHLQEDVGKIETETRLLENSVSVVMVIIVIASSLVVYFYILRPINTLTKAAKEYGQGNYEYEINIRGRDELGQLGNSFQKMSNQISTLIHTQEQTIAARTRALETSTEVSRRLSTILNREELVKEVVEQLVTAFNYYYAHIYLFEEDENTLVMKGGTGEAGRVMLSRGHTIPKGRGLVGRAAERNKTILVGDTLNEEGWLTNELLPETRSECAVPIAIGDKVLGVFDVQHNIVDGISNEDASLLQGVANQVAIAIQNARSYEDSRSRANLESLTNTINQKIQRATTVEETLEIAIKEVGQALGATRVSGYIAGSKKTAKEI